MHSLRRTGAVAIVLALVAGATLGADVKSEEKSVMKFEGMLGRMMGMFGGKAMRDGLVTTVAVKGNRKASFNEYTGQIIDLDEEKVYDLDMRGKKVTVKTFDQIRREMEEARRKAEQQAAQAGGGEQKKDPDGKEMEIDFDLKETGQKKTVNGFDDAREVVMTITVREKGRTLEQSGGIVLTANSWLAPKIAAMSEVAEFDRRYFEKLNGPAIAAEAMMAALAMYPGLAQAMSRFRQENVNMDGTAVATIVTFEAVRSAEQMEQAKKSEENSGGGGLGGLLARKMMKKKSDEGAASPRARIMTMNHDLLKVIPNATDADVAIPAGFQVKSS
jgi:hypothetical protein